MLPEDVAGAIQRYADSPDKSQLEDLFVTLGKGGFHTVEWMARQMQRFDSAIATTAAVMLDRGVFSPSAKIERIQDVGPARGFVMGLKIDPGAITLGELFIPDEIADVHAPFGLHRLAGLTAGNLRLPIDILASPLTYLSSPAGAAFRTAGLAGRAGRAVTLTKAGSRAYGKVLEAETRTAASAIQRKAAEAYGDKFYTVWAGPLGNAGAADIAGRKALLRGGFIPPSAAGAVDPIEVAVKEAHASIHRAASWGATKRMSEMIVHDPSLVRTPGLYFAGRVPVLPKSAWERPLKAAWEAVPGGKHVVAWSDQALQGASHLFGTTLSRARKAAPWLDQTKREGRGVAVTITEKSAPVIERLFAGLKNDELDSIGESAFKSLRGDTEGRVVLRGNPEATGKLFDDQADAYAHMYGQAVQTGIDLGEEYSYFPLRYRLSEAQWDALEEAEKVSKALARGGEGPRTMMVSGATGLGEASFRHARQFKTPEDAIAYWKELGQVHDGAEAIAAAAEAAPKKFFIYNAKELMQRRVLEQAKFMGDRHVALAIQERVGVDLADEVAQTIRRTFPDLANVERSAAAYEGQAFESNMLAAILGEANPKAVEEIVKILGGKGTAPVTKTFRELREAAQAAAARAAETLAKRLGREEIAPFTEIAQSATAPRDLIRYMQARHISARPGEPWLLAQPLHELRPPGGPPHMPPPRPKKWLWSGDVDPSLLKDLEDATEESLSYYAAEALRRGDTGELLQLFIHSSKLPETMRALAAVQLRELAVALKADRHLREVNLDLRRPTKALSDFSPKQLEAARSGIAKMTERQKAVFLEGASRNIHSLADVEEFVKIYDEHMMSVRVAEAEKARRVIGATRDKLFYDTLGRGYVELQGLATNTELNGWWVPKAIADDVSRMSRAGQKVPEPIRRAMRVHDLILARFKALQTVPFLAFNVRNTYSDISAAFTQIGLATFNPQILFHATNMILGRSGHFKIAGKAVPYEIEREFMGMLGVTQHVGEAIETVAPGGFHALVPKKFMATALRGEFEALTPGLKRIPGTGIEFSLRGLSAARENFGRTVLYLHERVVNGTAPEIASALVNRIFVDYQGLSAIEKGFFRRLFPFWTWNSRNIGIAFHNARRNPGRLSMMVKLSGRDYGPDEAFLPEYARGDMKLGAQFKNGNFAFLTGIDLPIGSALALTFPGSFSETFQNWVAMAHPARTWLDAYIYKRDPFSGKDLGDGAITYIEGSGRVVTHLPKPVQDWMEYREWSDPRTNQVYRTVNAAKWHVFVRGAFLARFAATADRYSRYLRDEGTGTHAAILDFIGGFRYQEFDVDLRQRKLIEQNIKLLEREGVKLGILRKLERPVPSKRVLNER
jgi:hypothetical protein